MCCYGVSLSQEVRYLRGDNVSARRGRTTLLNLALPPAGAAACDVGLSHVYEETQLVDLSTHRKSWATGTVEQVGTQNSNQPAL